MKDRLWYKSQSSDWMEGLPIGNGRLAGMLCGSETEDVLHLNHEWLWRGVTKDRDNDVASHMLQPTRDLIEKGDFYRATLMANTFYGGASGGCSGLPCRVDPYQPAGEIRFNFNTTKSFVSRSLDIVKGVAETKRETGDKDVTVTYIAHPVLNNIICHLSGSVSVDMTYTRIEDKNAVESIKADESKICYTCKFNGGTEYKTVIEYKTDGDVTLLDNGVSIKGGSFLTAFVNIATSVKGIEKELKEYPADFSLSWDEILKSHTDKFQDIMGRFSFDVECEECDDPTDVRIANIKNGGEDRELAFLYFNYGRYLLVSSSVCAELPANLQGKWNDRIAPPWESDYHFDINLQMNYWMAEQANMPECVDALINYCEKFLDHGKKAAMDLYGCRGIYIPLSSDAWARSTVEHLGWGVWIGAAPWLAQHFWWHYTYSMDKDFLKEHAYPFFKEVALFYEDYMVKDKKGVYQIMPSQSPENKFEGTGTLFDVSIGKSSSMDVQLAYDLLGYAIKSAEILGTDRDEAEKWQEMRDNLPEFKIGSDGRLLEWDEERKELEPGHRHLSHLYGIYPSDIFNEKDTPKQYEAAQKSFDYRMEHGGGHTGWSRAWCACLCARFARPDMVFENITEMIREFATISLLDLHPPRIFQIDGNFGAVSAMIEAVAQYVGDKLYLLRALPKQWNTGSIKNLRVPGGHTMSFEWQDGKVIRIKATVGKAESFTVVVDGKDLVINGKDGEVKEINL